MINAILEVNIKNLGEIHRVDTPFDEAIDALKAQGINEPTTAEQLAYARTQEGKRSSLCTNGSYVKEGDIYVPKKDIILVRKSLALQNPREITQAHRNEEEYFIDKKEAEKYFEIARDSKDDSAIILKNTSSIPTNRFGSDERTIWLLGGGFGKKAEKKAEDYGQFLRDAGINKMPLSFDDADYVKEQGKPYANQLWLGDLDYRSDLVGDDGGLDYYGRVRGVLKKKSKKD